MEDKNRKVAVKNRSVATVIINIPNRLIRKELAPGQTITSLTFGDLEELSFLPGGETLLKEYLQLSEIDVKELELGTPQPEYNYSEKDIENLIKNESLDLFLDCLDFAPIGVIDIIKKMAVELPMTDMKKIEALREKTGFDAAAAYKHIQEDLKEENGGVEAPVQKRRVVQSSSEPAKPQSGRRVIK